LLHSTSWRRFRRSRTHEAFWTEGHASACPSAGLTIAQPPTIPPCAAAAPPIIQKSDVGSSFLKQQWLRSFLPREFFPTSVPPLSATVHASLPSSQTRPPFRSIRSQAPSLFAREVSR